MSFAGGLALLAASYCVYDWRRQQQASAGRHDGIVLNPRAQIPKLAVLLALASGAFVALHLLSGSWRDTARSADRSVSTRTRTRPFR
jgi:hypothetical protein